MGARIIVVTKRPILATPRMEQQRMFITLFHPCMYMMQDEYFEDQLLPMVFEGMDTVKPHSVSSGVIEALGKKTDEEIIAWHTYKWQRYTLFWDIYKQAVIEYSLAKRDFCKACTDAEIDDVSMIVSTRVVNHNAEFTKKLVKENNELNRELSIVKDRLRKCHERARAGKCK